MRQTKHYINLKIFENGKFLDIDDNSTFTERLATEIHEFLFRGT
jgi:hypothetical protein